MPIAGRESKVSNMDAGRLMATQIMGAQLKSMGGPFLPYGNRSAVLDAADSFMGIGGAPSGADRPRGFATVVFTDLVASTELLARLGDDEGREAFRWVEETTAGLAEDHHGEVIKYTGDGSLVAFASTSGALAFAVSMMGAMADSPMELRIGMAAGEPIAEGGDLHGAVVHQASRIADAAAAGEIVVADSVRQLALGKGFDFEETGEAKLKGFDEPVRLWRLAL